MAGPRDESASTPPPTPPSPPARDGLPSRGAAAGRIARSAASALLIVLGCVLVPVSVLTVWVHDIALNTQRYVATVSPLADDKAIQDAAVHRVTEAVNDNQDSETVTADVAAWLRSQGLPPRAADAVKRLAPQLDSAIDEIVRKVATRFVRSDEFAAVWIGANRAAHAALVHALTGEGNGAVGVSDGTVTLNVGTAVENVKKQLEDAGLDPASHIPTVNKRMVLFHSDQLDRIRDGARALDLAGDWLPVLTVAIGAAGVLLAHRRRRALARAALGSAFGCLVVVIGLVIARRYYLDHVPPRVLTRAAAAEVFDTLLRFLRVTLRTVIVLGGVVALGAYLAGPGRLPRAARDRAERAADTVARWGAAHGVRTGRAGAWTAEHRTRLTVAVPAVLSVVFALWNHPTVLTVLFLALILLAALAVIALLAATDRFTRSAGASPAPAAPVYGTGPTGRGDARRP